MNGYKDIRVLETDGLPITEEIDSKKICDKFIEFYNLVMRKYKRLDWVFPDSASPTLINSLRSAAKEAGLNSKIIVGCKKNEVADRPILLDMLFNTGRLLINKKCVELIKAIGTLRWDEKNPNIPEDKNIANCNDWYDALMYTMLNYIDYIGLNR